MAPSAKLGSLLKIYFFPHHIDVLEVFHRLLRS